MARPIGVEDELRPIAQTQLVTMAEKNGRAPAHGARLPAVVSFIEPAVITIERQIFGVHKWFRPCIVDY